MSWWRLRKGKGGSTGRAGAGMPRRRFLSCALIPFVPLTAGAGRKAYAALSDPRIMESGASFATQADAFLAALPRFVEEANALADEAYFRALAEKGIYRSGTGS